ncbi:Copper amine oxidase family protein [Dorcoceras hygrometricum]|uniref:Copper amine oxidase family protein n=1 Tax=Dorcoceras hygrometricum TaxID=472368 RepID=A0A2Z7CT60_9LAMI|nr:Copper amine oxidase family protein [Dorcoceras hygrometricum]
MARTPPTGQPLGPAAPLGRVMGCNARMSHAKIHPHTARWATQQVDLGLTKTAEPPPLIHGPPPDHLESNPSSMNRPRPKHLKKQFKYKILPGTAALAYTTASSLVTTQQYSRDFPGAQIQKLTRTGDCSTQLSREHTTPSFFALLL